MKTLIELKENQAFQFENRQGNNFTRLQEIGYGKIAIMDTYKNVSLADEDSKVNEIPSTDQTINNVYSVIDKLDEIVKSAGLQLTNSNLEFAKRGTDECSINYTFFYNGTNDTVYMWSFNGLELTHLENKLKEKLNEIKPEIQ